MSISIVAHRLLPSGLWALQARLTLHVNTTSGCITLKKNWLLYDVPLNRGNGDRCSFYLCVGAAGSASGLEACSPADPRYRECE